MSVTAAPAPRECKRCDSPLEDGDQRCAVCALPVPAMPLTVEQERVKVLRCTQCGAAIAFDANHQAPKCGFCSSLMKVEQPHDPIETAQLRVPFSVERDLATAALRGWLGKRGFFAPKALRDDAVVESVSPLCWAAWIVNAEALITWAADSDEGSHRSAWAPHAGQTKQTFGNIAVPASRGLRHDECSQLVPYYDLSQAVGVSEAIAGEVPAMIESFDVQRSAARREVSRAIETLAKVRVQNHQIPGNRFRNVHVSCLLERQTTTRVALPAWVLAYRYRGSPYRAIVHGTRPEIVFGSSPIDWGKVGKLVGSIVLGIAAIIAAIVLLSGCGNSEPPRIDVPDFTEFCVAEQPTFEPLSGRAAVKGVLNVHVDAGGLITVDTSSDVIFALDLTQTGTQVAITAQLCEINIPDVPLAGQDMPIHFEVTKATIDSVGTVSGTAMLESASSTCARLDSEPITLVLGARLDPAAIATAPLPTSANDGTFPACAPSADTACAQATGTNCACDQEGDGLPGATLIARNVPAIELDQVYVSLRTSFALHGKVWNSDLVKGRIDATTETGVLACKLLDGTMCGPNNLRTVRTLNPVITQQPSTPSTFRAVRVGAGMTCAEIVANKATVFPR